MSTETTNIPRWFLVVTSIALLSVSTWAIRESSRPRWIVIEKLQPDGSVILDQRSGRLCIVGWNREERSSCHTLDD